jgi:hydroxymethylbilane synthase
MIEDGLLFVTATVYKPDGTKALTSSHATSLEGAAPHALLAAAGDAASRVVAELLDGGAAELAPIGGAA